MVQCVFDEHFDLRDSLSVGWTRAARRAPETRTRVFQVWGRMGWAWVPMCRARAVAGTGERGLDVDGLAWARVR